MATEPPFEVLVRETVKYTASGHGYYRVLVEGEEVSKHTTEREALESAANHYEDGLDVRVVHDYEVKVVKNAKGKIVRVRLKTNKLKLNTPMAIVTYTSPPLGQTNPDTVPDQFTFTDQTDVALAALITSNHITLSGTTLPTTITISGTGDPQYQITGGSWTNAAGTIYPGQSVRVRHTSSAFPALARDTVLTIGGVSDTFTSTTVGGFQQVAYDGLVIPPDSVLFFDEGQHTGANNSASLVDSTKAWAIDENQNLVIRNTSDNSSGIATSNTLTETFVTLTGGTDNDFDTGNYYEIVADITAGDLIEYTGVTDLGGTVTMNVKGVPVITGVSGTHTFSWRVFDNTLGQYTNTEDFIVTV